MKERAEEVTCGQDLKNGFAIIHQKMSCFLETDNDTEDGCCVHNGSAHEFLFRQNNLKVVL